MQIPYYVEVQMSLEDIKNLLKLQLFLMSGLIIFGIKKIAFTTEKDDGEVKVFETPICAYCYNEGCTAGHQLINELYRAGFTNVIDYKGGIQEWDKVHKKKSKKTSSKK